MGTCFSIQLSGDDQSLSRIFSFLCGNGYIRNLKKNLKDLEREMEDLNAIQLQLKNKVAREETQRRQKIEPVKVWLNRVEKTQTVFTDLSSRSLIQLQKLCLCDLWSEDVSLSYSYGKSVFDLLEDVKKLKSEGKQFDVVTELIPISEVEKRNTRPTIGNEETVEKAWNRLMDDRVCVIGLHGMGGVGKTTVFNHIHNKLASIPPGTFDVVIWVDASRGAEISKLQEDIAKKLQLCSDGWTNKTESDKASDIHRVLIKKRFVLMVDNIWEKMDLEAIGVPVPTRENRCKVTFTTRTMDVCTKMGDHDPIEVKCLEWDKAWELFKYKVGDKVLESDPIIVELARKVAEKCCGLPLALDVIGETMSSKTYVREWKDAINDLNKSAAEFPDIENKILRILRFSYDSLVNEHVKSCFIYCALFPEGSRIDKERLVEYWIGEGFIGEKVIREAIDKGHGFICTLIRANLLTQINAEKVVMHDVIREMALWIASDFGKQKENYVVQANAGLRKIPKVEEWGAVRRMSLIENEIEEISCSPKCCELTTLLLRSNNLKILSGEFIGSMQKLFVLDLSLNKSFKELPEQISELTSLQYLDLSYTVIEQLPVGFQKWKKLTHLNLAYTFMLRSLSGISKLSSLRILKLRGSKVDGDVGLVKELQLLKHLQSLSIKISTDLGLLQILGDQRFGKCIDDLHVSVQRKPTINLSSLMSMGNLRCLYLIYDVHLSEIGLHNRTIPCFTNLATIEMNGCKSIKDLTWLLFAPNLVTLTVRFAGMKEIINKEKAANLTGYSPFHKLESLQLHKLPKLESIYWSPLPFPFLKSISIAGCPNLRKLPLNAASAPRIGELSIKMDLGKPVKLEWEDEDTKNHFLPLINRLKLAIQLGMSIEMLNGRGIGER